jgi:hypothetical protein
VTRLAVGFDRVVTALVGLALLTAAGLTVAWCTGHLGGGRPVRVLVEDATHAPWWPWASGGVGVALVLIGLRWLAAHRRAPRASRVRLPATTATADATAAADAAASVLAGQPAILKATGAAVVERGTPTLTMTVTVVPRHGLAAAVTAADEDAHTLATMLGDAVAVRHVVRVDARKRRSAVV